MFMRSFKLLLLKLVKDVISHGFKEKAMALRLNALLQPLISSQGFDVNHALLKLGVSSYTNFLASIISLSRLNISHPMLILAER